MYIFSNLYNVSINKGNKMKTNLIIFTILMSSKQAHAYIGPMNMMNNGINQVTNSMNQLGEYEEERERERLNEQYRMQRIQQENQLRMENEVNQRADNMIWRNNTTENTVKAQRRGQFIYFDNGQILEIIGNRACDTLNMTNCIQIQ